MPEHVTKDPRSGWAAIRRGAVVDAKGGYDWDASGNPQILDSAGTAQATATTSGLSVPSLIAAAGIRSAAAGSANSFGQTVVRATNIPSGAATSVLRLSIPNGNHSAMLRITVQLWTVDSADAYEVTRTFDFHVAVSRISGAVSVVATGATTTTAQAVAVGGVTLTAAMSATAPTGANGATQTSDVQINVTMSAGSANIGVLMNVTAMNANADGVTYVGV